MNSELEIEYDSAKVQSPAVQELRELWRYRDLLQLLISTSIKSRYKRSSLGIVWTLLNPLLNTIVLSIVFSFFFSRFEIRNYPIYILSGLLMWNFFSQTTLHSMNKLIWGSGLIKRIYVPRTIFAVSVVGNGLVNLLLGFIPLLIIMLVLGQPFSLALFSLPLAILLLAMFTLGMALFLSTIAVYFVDMVDMFGILLSIWFYATPIIYPESMLPDRFQFLLRLNPVYYLLETFRAPIASGTWPAPDQLLLAATISVFTLAVGWLTFTRKSNEFAYRI
jgi:ABC-type polysaccharide/polyol phosphate export permease